MTTANDDKRPWVEPAVTPDEGEVLRGGHAGGGKTRVVRDEVTLTPRQLDRLTNLRGRVPGVRGYTGGLPTAFGRDAVVGVDPANGPDRSTLVLYTEGRVEHVAEVRLDGRIVYADPEPTPLRALWACVRPRQFVRARFVFEPRDWWAGMYGPVEDATAGQVHLYFGLFLPWVLCLTFDLGVWREVQSGDDQS